VSKKLCLSPDEGRFVTKVCQCWERLHTHRAHGITMALPQHSSLHAKANKQRAHLTTGDVAATANHRPVRWLCLIRRAPQSRVVQEPKRVGRSSAQSTRHAPTFRSSVLSEGGSNFLPHVKSINFTEHTSSEGNSRLQATGLNPFKHYPPTYT
jgi:hypothetical protein